MKNVFLIALMLSVGSMLGSVPEKAHAPSFTIGLCLRDAYDNRVSLPINLCTQLGQIPGTVLYVLHPLDADELRALPENVEIHQFDPHVRTAKEVLAAQVQVISRLDVLMTADPLLAHMGGRLQIPTWAVLPAEQQPRYPSVRLVSQFGVSDDATVIELVQAVRSLRQPGSDRVLAEVSFGELIDKMSVLAIKKQRIKDAEKLANVMREYEALRKTFEETVTPSLPLEELITELTNTNGQMWDIGDSLREKERSNTVGDEEFIHLARLVYRTNDRRVAIKRKIDAMLGSHIIEEKQYAQY